MISFFTSIPLNKTIDIILDKILNQKVLHTTIKRWTMKKLLRDACTKTPFSINGELYQQIDGVYGFTTTLANIIMTAI